MLHSHQAETGVVIKHYPTCYLQGTNAATCDLCRLLRNAESAGFSRGIEAMRLNVSRLARPIIDNMLEPLGQAQHTCYSQDCEPCNAMLAVDRLAHNAKLLIQKGSNDNS